MSNAWKRAEKKAAEMLGGKRNSRGFNFSASIADMEHPLFSVEVKHRKRLPVLLANGLSQAASYESRKPPLLVLHEAGSREMLVVLKIKDFVDLFGPLKSNQE